MNFKGKKIGILGLGGENVAMVKFLASYGGEITICDRAEGEEAISSYTKQLSGVNYQLRLGPAYLDNLKDFDIVFRTPGLPYLNEKIQEAKESGVEISSQTKLFFDLCPSPIIGVTGTKGKGTTTSLIGEILNKSVNAQGSSTFINRVYVAGNIGRAPIEFVQELTKDDVVVLELSSFQLQDLHKSPHIGVVLDIKSDHLDVHKDHDEYVLAKTAIVKYQTKNDFAVVNADYSVSTDFALKTPAEVFWFSRKRSVDQGIFVENENLLLRIEGKNHLIANKKEITLRGDHNLENIAAASIAAYLSGVGIDTIRSVVKKFKGLEHRLEFVAQIGGVKYYNDSFSTTPDTAIAAINAFSEPVILIAGGSEKNADYSELGEEISKNVKTVILIGQTGPRIKKEIKNTSLKIIDDLSNLREVMQAVKKEAKKGDIVLLSPASASFDWFVNYKDRGLQFKKLVLKETS
ncbi:TPA: UDP-N-acetylmuramoyl-L-alanine--D-glutamate ligase [Candidatus Berkelbacteria bacterium]|uniref:UDP-N-acetylmuramoylalanine--D-glutamate ligase n=1 Tax=Berkelbacteria bacterium GW2011_GWE1_39_12 TaxID=1618337 RepID=A0A0G4B1U7_9BACT|nr:MAG: UDP-N-acetylmuramoylalanine--D-glutamate ligase, UDP-N-acetylmuramoylalanine--D-glutamate ligase [Berkelbacteria bacterium GW2011_GWE1_39_12]HBO60503.1 UDP-N-acetylmuramoyl-L-alanine--D-glutamate ligase [Candidatus Berkelbacteria bacterium]